MTETPVALALVSHSALIAAGVRDLAAQMAPDVTIMACGGDPDGGLGTSFDAVSEVLEQSLQASDGKGVVILSDLGSAILTVDTVLEVLGDQTLFRHPAGPFIEGAVAAAVAAQLGQDVDAVAASVTKAAELMFAETEPSQAAAGAQTVRCTVGDRTGLHARPAAKLAALAGSFESEVWVNGANARSALEIMTMALPHGHSVVVQATGADAKEAATAVAAAIDAGLDGN